MTAIQAFLVVSVISGLHQLLIGKRQESQISRPVGESCRWARWKDGYHREMLQKMNSLVCAATRQYGIWTGSWVPQVGAMEQVGEWVPRAGIRVQAVVQIGAQVLQVGGMSRSYGMWTDDQMQWVQEQVKKWCEFLWDFGCGKPSREGCKWQSYDCRTLQHCNYKLVIKCPNYNYVIAEIL